MDPPLLRFSTKDSDYFGEIEEADEAPPTMNKADAHYRNSSNTEKKIEEYQQSLKALRLKQLDSLDKMRITECYCKNFKEHSIEDILQDIDGVKLPRHLKMPVHSLRQWASRPFLFSTQPAAIGYVMANLNGTLADLKPW